MLHFRHPKSHSTGQINEERKTGKLYLNVILLMFAVYFTKWLNILYPTDCFLLKIKRLHKLFHTEFCFIKFVIFFQIFENRKLIDNQVCFL